MNNNLLSEGFIRLPRALMNLHGVLEKEELTKFEAHSDLIYCSRFSDSPVVFYWKGSKVIYGRKQLVASTRHLAERWGWSTMKVRRFLAYLEASGWISTDASLGITVITITEPVFYEEAETSGDTDAVISNEIKPSTNSNKENNDNKEKKKLEKIYKKEFSNFSFNDSYYFNEVFHGDDGQINSKYIAYKTEEFLSLWKKFFEYRLHLKKNFSRAAEKELFKHLIEICKAPAEAPAVINQTIRNGWADFFTLRDGKSKNTGLTAELKNNPEDYGQL